MSLGDLTTCGEDEQQRAVGTEGQQVDSTQLCSAHPQPPPAPAVPRQMKLWPLRSPIPNSLFLNGYSDLSRRIYLTILVAS